MCEASAVAKCLLVINCPSSVSANLSVRDGPYLDGKISTSHVPRTTSERKASLALLRSFSGLASKIFRTEFRRKLSTHAKFHFSLQICLTLFITSIPELRVRKECNSWARVHSSTKEENLATL